MFELILEKKAIPIKQTTFLKSIYSLLSRETNINRTINSLDLKFVSK